MDGVQVRENLTVEILPMQIEDREVKQLHGNENNLVKAMWEGPAGGSVTCELESQMRESYPTLFLSGNFLGQKLFKRGRVVTPCFYNSFI